MAPLRDEVQSPERPLDEEAAVSLNDGDRAGGKEDMRSWSTSVHSVSFALRGSVFCERFSNALK